MVQYLKQQHAVNSVHESLTGWVRVGSPASSHRTITWCHLNCLSILNLNPRSELHLSVMITIFCTNLCVSVVCFGIDCHHWKSVMWFRHVANTAVLIQKKKNKVKKNDVELYWASPKIFNINTQQQTDSTPVQFDSKRVSRWIQQIYH